VSAGGPPAVAPTELTAEARAALLRKYRLLLGWRRARDAAAGAPSVEPAPVRGDAPATPAAMRALAVEFPGCLRELDLLGAAELARRVTVLEAEPSPAISPSKAWPPPSEAWMIWIWTYHRMLAAALEDRRRVAPASVGAPAGPPGLVADFVRASRAPAEGRLSRVAIVCLADALGVPPAQLSATLFPARRPRAA
jgi:hypothetical protein